jgi:hypothetical protein
MNLMYEYVRNEPLIQYKGSGGIIRRKNVLQSTLSQRGDLSFKGSCSTIDQVTHTGVPAPGVSSQERESVTGALFLLAIILGENMRGF